MEKKKTIRKKTAKTSKKTIKKKTTKTVVKKTKKTIKKPGVKTKVERKKKTVEAKKKKETKKPGENAIKKPGAKKLGVKKREVEKAKKKTKEVEKKVTAKEKRTRIAKVEKVKKEPKEIALPRKVSRLPLRTKRAIEEKAGTPTTKLIPETYPQIKPMAGLPAEYMEDRITLMVIDPWKLFAYWEIRKNTFSKVKGILVLRVYDVTGIDFDGKNANVIFNLAVFDRVGDGYIGVAPGRDFIVDLGSISEKGDFTLIARSNKVTTPALRVAKGEGVLPEEIYETGPVIGYS